MGCKEISFYEREFANKYLFSQYKEARYFLPMLGSYEINYSIIQQLPLRVREALTAIDYSDRNKLTQALAHLDLTHEERENGRRSQQNRYQSDIKLKEFQPKIRGLQHDLQGVNGNMRGLGNKQSRFSAYSNACKCQHYNCDSNRSTPEYLSTNKISFQSNSS